MVRINLGAGSQSAAGFIGYDRSRLPLLARNPVLRRVTNGRWAHWPPDTRVHDVTKGIPHADASVDVVYTSHMVEHLRREQAEYFFSECHRVLKPGGLLRIVVPDLRAIVTAYLEGNREMFKNPTPALADTLARSLYGESRKPEKLPVRTLKRVLRSDDGGHKWMYDEESLRGHLERAGFHDIVRTERGVSRDPEAGALDIGRDIHLHMEALR
jgi:predicted SAM-dependent methyltransferase